MTINSTNITGYSSFGLDKVCLTCTIKACRPLNIGQVFMDYLEVNSFPADTLTDTFFEHTHVLVQHNFVRILYSRLEVWSISPGFYVLVILR